MGKPPLWICRKGHKNEWKEPVCKKCGQRRP